MGVFHRPGGIARISAITLALGSKASCFASYAAALRETETSGAIVR